MSTAEKLNPAVQIKLKVLKGPHEGQSFHLTKSSFTVGRGPENEVVLINDPQVSRQHARLQVVGQDIEIINLSQKNKVKVGNEIVQKWKLLNDSTFIIGDTEIQIIYDLGKVAPYYVSAGVPVPKSSTLSAPNPATPSPSPLPSPLQALQPLQKTPQKRNNVPVRPNVNVPTRPQVQKPQVRTQPMAQPTYAIPSGTLVAQDGLLANPKARFYLILGLVVLGLGYWMMDEPAKSNKKQEIKSTLRYEDEFLIKQNSVAEKELEEKRRSQKEKKQTPTALRIEENFQKGMRDFYLGNYPRAQDFFILVLNLDPGHTMARRHSYLAKIRFDEIVKMKLALGESYYQKHNFKMCRAMYEQVLTMLEGKKDDLSYQTAQSMSEKCELAAEGIR